jgi:hypothetical protein
MPHDHIEPKEGDRRVAIAIWANGLLTIAQIVGGDTLRHSRPDCGCHPQLF